ncbi:MAG: cystathionine beta-synthase, partial [Gillisia sp.]|nr:cystathionine beta-synthase [Gillisia sp.]
MEDNKMLNYIKDVLENMPTGWLNLTTHRLDIYDEKLAKTQFLEQFETLFNDNNSEPSALKELPTAYDYIRLGHPLSCILEWGIANLNNLKPENVISFSSRTIPVLAILRKNLLDNKNTQIIYTGELPQFFEPEVLRRVYGYKFELKQVEKASAISGFNGSTIFISQQDEIGAIDLTPNIDFFISVHAHLGSVLLINGEQNESYISAI